MNPHDHRDLPSEGQLAGFFPGKRELSSFVTGLFLGVVLLAVLAGLGFMIKGHLGIWPTF
jgi:hypothetical protein